MKEEEAEHKKNSINSLCNNFLDDNSIIIPVAINS
jgi:hypothetical protein